jgi:hypothetical protein
MQFGARFAHRLHGAIAGAGFSGGPRDARSAGALQAPALIRQV